MQRVRETDEWLQHFQKMWFKEDDENGDLPLLNRTIERLVELGEKVDQAKSRLAGIRRRWRPRASPKQAKKKQGPKGSKPASRRKS